MATSGSDKTLLYLGIAGVVGFGLYTYLKNEYYYQIGYMTMPKMSEPSFVEILLGSAQSVLAQGRMLDDAMKLRGPAHYSAWQQAVKSGAINYLVEGTCFVTKTGAVCA